MNRIKEIAPFLIDPELNDTDGLIDLVIEYASAAVEPKPDRSSVHGGAETRDKAQQTAIRVRTQEKHVEARVREEVAAQKEKTDALGLELQVKRAQGPGHA